MNVVVDVIQTYKEKILQTHISTLLIIILINEAMQNEVNSTEIQMQAPSQKSDMEILTKTLAT